MKKLLVFPVLIYLITISLACTRETPAEETITVSILPLHYFVQRIGGKGYHINVMIPPGQSPATYEPTPQQMVLLSNSRAYFRIGHIPFEQVFMKSIAAASKSMAIFDTSQGVDLIRGGHHHEGHGHGDETGIDPHIWLSPRAVKIIAGNILSGLIDIDPAKADMYRRNHDSFVAELDELDRFISRELKDKKGKKFLVYHPVWAYFARDYGIVQYPIEVEGKEPDPAHMREVIDRARKEKIRVIFVQKQFPREYAKALAGDIGGRVIHLDPLAQDWMANMKQIAETFSREL